MPESCQQPRFQDLFDFFMSHPEAVGREKDILTFLTSAAQSGVLCYTQDMNQKVNGCLLGYFENPKTIFVALTMAKTREAFRQIVTWFWNRYPECSVKAKRKGKVVTYRTPEVYRKILSNAS